MADDHKTVVLSIMATLLCAIVVFIFTVAVSGGVSTALIQAYVYPLLLTAFSLTLFACVLYARNKGKIPGFNPEKPAKQNEPQPQSETGPS